ncbi:hypothetical protein FWK35_00005670, partial [Aphis craccivora]
VIKVIPNIDPRKNSLFTNSGLNSHLPYIYNNAGERYFLLQYILVFLLYVVYRLFLHAICGLPHTRRLPRRLTISFY